MSTRKENLYVVTGGPGVGKTTLVNELAKCGYKIVPEDAREIIKTEVQNNRTGVPWKNKERYTQLMLEASLLSYNRVLQNNTDIYFFDRGILDTLCFASMTGLGISSEMTTIANTHLYNQKVFILPPWLEIYHKDNERKQTWAEAKLTFTKMKETYQNYGYQIIEVPKDTIENRVEFIINNIKRAVPNL